MSVSQIKTRDRVRDLGEVYTNEREVKAMMDLVMDEGYKISSRFLEPACGNGNFLEEILKRKLDTVAKVSKGQVHFEYNIVKSISSIYGVDICIDNVIESRDRLLQVIKSFYSMNRNTNIASDGFYESINYILSKNIFEGDFINGEKYENGEPKIIFSEFQNRKQDKRNHLVERLFSMTSMKEDNPIPLFEYEARMYNDLYSNDVNQKRMAIVQDVISKIPKSMFENPKSTFFDPYVVNGVFIMEIVYKLFNTLPHIKHKDDDGICFDLGDDSQRLNHILKNMVFGMSGSEVDARVAMFNIYGKSMLSNSSNQYRTDNYRKIKTDELIDVEVIKKSKIEGEKYFGNIYFRTERPLIPCDEYGLISPPDYFEHTVIDRLYKSELMFDVVVGWFTVDKYRRSLADTQAEITGIKMFSNASEKTKLISHCDLYETLGFCCFKTHQLKIDNGYGRMFYYFILEDSKRNKVCEVCSGGFE